MSSKLDRLNINISKFSNIVFFDIGMYCFTFFDHIHIHTYIELAFYFVYNIIYILEGGPPLHGVYTHPRLPY